MTETRRDPLPVDFEFAGYRVGEVVGRGGFAITYRAHEFAPDLDRDVALKEYFPKGIAWRGGDGIHVEAVDGEKGEDYQFCLDCFRREAETLLRFRHPAIIDVLRYFEANGTAYMVMDYEPGESLHDILLRGTRLPEAWLRSILFPLLEGLELIHSKDFFHRDIKPSNIFVRDDGSPVLLDFGAARQTLSKHSLDLDIILTPPYSPIEQYSAGGHQGPWTDIYALGMTLYVAATGLKPPEAKVREAALKSAEPDPIAHAINAPDTQCSEAFLRAIDGAIAYLPADRPQTIAEWRELLGPATDEDISVPSPVPTGKPIGDRKSEAGVDTKKS